MTRVEWQAAGTKGPTARVWGETGGEAATLYARAFKLAPGSNVLARPLDNPEAAELFSITAQGLKRLTPGGVK